MRLLSPSSRLVLVAVVIALLALTFVARTPGTETPTPTVPPAAAGTLSEPSDGGFGASSPADGAEASVAPSPTSGSTATPTVRATPRPVACKPTDQVNYVYNPDRLQVVAACIDVSGTVQAVRTEADGDLHILLRLDPAYTYLLRPANQGVELGDLVVEPVCVRTVTQVDAEATCAADPDPLAPPFPSVGERVWMEGRYVFDLDHGGLAELHPLYRWGPM